MCLSSVVVRALFSKMVKSRPNIPEPTVRNIDHDAIAHAHSGFRVPVSCSESIHQGCSKYF